MYCRSAIGVLCVLLNMKTIILPVLLFFPILSCTNMSESKVDVPYVITTADLNEADQLREILDSTGGAKGNFRVTPGAKVTTVHFKSPDKPLDEAAARKWMKTIKARITKANGREANMLKFIFKGVTLSE